MENDKPLSNGQVALAITVLFIVLGVVGRWDYEDALITEQAVAAATVRTLMCKDKTDHTDREHSQADQAAMKAADYRFTEQAADVVVLGCIIVTD